ncbi:MAG: rod shape-determining protein MreD [Prevotella sp.]|nr:rod shape-determining protein MreD [Prevotella sp.]
MAIDFFIRLALFVGLCAVQVLILNHIHLFDVATPLLYIYFVFTFRRNYPRWMVLLWSFSLGLVMDVFTNTPGLAAGTMTLIGFLQPYLLELMLPRDAADNLESSTYTLGIGKFSLMCLILTLLYCLVFYALEAFTFFEWLLWLERVGGSAALTLILVIVIDSVRSA